MIALPLHHMSYKADTHIGLKKEDLPRNLREKKGILSRGSLSVFKGEGLERFAQITVKGLNIYFYDFGIAYPANEKDYPIFLYQIISAPKRVLAVVHYASNNPHKWSEMPVFKELLDIDLDYSGMLIKAFEPQEFLKEDIIPNAFNGLIRTVEIDKAYDKVFHLFEKWYEGLQLSQDLIEDLAAYQQWLTGFKEKFYKEDYGFTATKKFLGEKWAKEAFENYLFY